MHDRRQLIPLAGLALAFSVALSFYISDLDTLSLGAVMAPLWLIAAGASVLSPPVFVFMLLAVSTNGFGLIDMSQQLAADLRLDDATLFSLTAGVIISALMRIATRRFVARISAYSALTALLLSLVTIICVLTSIRWEQDPWLSVKAAREFLFYAFILLGSLVAYSEKNVRGVVRAIVVAGVISSCVSIVGFFVDLSPYLAGISTRGAGQTITSIEFYRTTNPGYAVDFLALFIAYFDRVVFRPGTRTLILVVTGLASIMMGYRAFWIGILGSVLWILFFDPERRQAFKASARRAIGGALLVLIVLMAFNAQRVVTHRVAVIQEELGKTQSLGYRVEVIRGLWTLFQRNVLLGVGFAHPDGAGASLAPSVGLRSTATIDVGWIDLLVKFGVLGGIALLLIARRLLRELRLERRPGLADFATATRAYFIMGVFALPGAAIFTWPGGILPLAVALFTLEASRPHSSLVAIPTRTRPMVQLAR